MVIILGLAAMDSRAAEGGARLLEQRFKQLDANNDGSLTAAEADHAPWFKGFDRNRDGVLTLDEVRAVASQFQGGAPNAASPADAGQMFKWLDKNSDGALTREELPRADMFDRLDENQDGKISPAEAKAALERLSAVARGSNLNSLTPTTGAPVQEAPAHGPQVLRPGDAGVGRRVPDLAFTDIGGKAGRLSDYQQDRGLVIAFTSTSCPVGKRFTPALARLEKEFGARGVKFLYVNPTETDSSDSIKAAIAEHGLAGRYVHDGDDALARALGAASTTEVFVLDAARTVVYRGAVSDQYGVTYSLDAPRREYLADALEALLAGQPPRVAATTAPGCALEFESAKAPDEVTYHNRISRVLQHNCVECHRAGGVAPFSLEKYEEVVAHAGMIRRQVERGQMPPWFAAPAAPGEPSPWVNDRSLAAADKADLLAWLKGGRTLGDPADAPLPRKFPEDWAIGTPDLVVQLPHPIAIKAEGTMPYQNVVVETGLAEDKWVQALEVQPGVREVVHHVLVFARPPRTAGDDAFDDSAAERQGFFAAYVPGNGHAIFPDGFARKLPAGSRLHFQIHYTPNGRAVSDRTRLGVVFAKEPPKHVLGVSSVAKVALNIPPHAAHHPEVATLRVPFDAWVTAFMPHMHVRGKAFKYEAEFPDGAKRVLLDIPRYDFNWQLSYQLAEPVKLPAGTVLRATAIYDNSANNPANPNPNVTVRWGPQTFNEMMLGYLEYFTASNELMPHRPGRRRAGAE